MIGLSALRPVSEHIDVTGLSDGGWLVVYKPDNGVALYQQRYNSAGQKVGGPISATHTSGDFAGHPAVQGLEDGGWVVVYFVNHADGTGSASLFQQRFDATGQKVGLEEQLNTSEIPLINSSVGRTVASLDIIPDKGWIVTWSDSTNIYLQRFDMNGLKVGDTTLVNFQSGTPQVGAHVTVLEDGGWIVNWWSEETATSPVSHVYQQRFDANGNKIALDEYQPPDVVDAYLLEQAFQAENDHGTSDFEAPTLEKVSGFDDAHHVDHGLQQEFKVQTVMGIEAGHQTEHSDRAGIHPTDETPPPDVKNSDTSYGDTVQDIVSNVESADAPRDDQGNLWLFEYFRDHQVELDNSVLAVVAPGYEHKSGLPYDASDVTQLTALLEAPKVDLVKPTSGDLDFRETGDKPVYSSLDEKDGTNPSPIHNAEQCGSSIQSATTLNMWTDESGPLVV